MQWQELSVCACFELLGFGLGISENDDFLVFILEEIIFEYRVFLRIRVAQNADVVNLLGNLGGVSANQVE